MEEYLKEVGCELLSLSAYRHHAEISINANPAMSPISIFTGLRSKTSTILRREFAELNRAPTLWNRALLVSTSPIEKQECDEFLLKHKRKINKKPKE